MGALRTEPKHKSFLTQEEYDEIHAVLKEAQRLCEDNHVFWDMESNEKASQVKKAFIFVARKADLDVTIRQVRGANSLAFYFKKNKSAGPTRMTANESRNRILRCLENAGKPLKKNQIIKETNVSPSTWNIRIKELLKENEVTRHGDRRDTTYTLTK